MLWWLGSTAWPSFESQSGMATWSLAVLTLHYAEVMISWCTYTNIDQNDISAFRKLQVCINNPYLIIPYDVQTLLRIFVQTVAVTCCFVAIIQLEFRSS